MKLLILGGRGMVGRALIRQASLLGVSEVLAPTRQDLDLLNQQETFTYIKKHEPSCVIVAAAKVGGIYANDTFPANFLNENLLIASNTIEGAYRAGVKRLLFLGSSCIYPKFAEQPIVEESLLTGALESTNEAYAIAKIAGLKLCQYYRKQHGVMYHSIMPTNLYGKGDNYHSKNSHVIPAMIERFHEAKVKKLKKVVIWGSGTPRREFLYVDDLAEACFLLLDSEEAPDWINCGYGSDVTIMELAQAVSDTVGFVGEIGVDLTKPDGTPQKLMNSSKLRKLGWTPKVELKKGLKYAYINYLQSLEKNRLRRG